MADWSLLRRGDFAGVVTIAREPWTWVARHATALALGIVVLAVLSGCGTTQSGTAMDKALDLVGLQRPAPAMPTGQSDSAVRPTPAMTKVTLRLHAGDVLNTTTDGRSLSVVARVYKLRDRTAFEQLSYEALQDTGASGPRPTAQSGQADWAARDVVEVKEIVLAPGQKFEAIETVPAEAPYVGVVALFRSPAGQRWRFVFEAQGAAQTGLTLGVHACALSVAVGHPLGAAPDTLRLAGVRCA